jgi:hypothetical protein
MVGTARLAVVGALAAGGHVCSAHWGCSVQFSVRSICTICTVQAVCDVLVLPVGTDCRHAYHKRAEQRACVKSTPCPSGPPVVYPPALVQKSSSCLNTPRASRQVPRKILPSQ